MSSTRNHSHRCDTNPLNMVQCKVVSRAVLIVTPFPRGGGRQMDDVRLLLSGGKG